MVAEHCAARRAAAKARGGRAGFFGDDQINGTIAADLQHIIVLAKIGIDLAVLQIGAEAAKCGQDRLAAGGMFGHLARQAEQPYGLFQRDIRRTHALGQ